MVEGALATGRTATSSPVRGRPAVQVCSPSSSHSRQTHSPSCFSSALRAAGTIVTPQQTQIGARSSSAASSSPFTRSVAATCHRLETPKPATLGSEELPGYGLRHCDSLRSRLLLSTDARAASSSRPTPRISAWSFRKAFTTLVRRAISRFDLLEPAFIAHDDKADGRITPEVLLSEETLSRNPAAGRGSEPLEAAHLQVLHVRTARRSAARLLPEIASDAPVQATPDLVLQGKRINGSDGTRTRDLRRDRRRKGKPASPPDEPEEPD